MVKKMLWIVQVKINLTGQLKTPLHSLDKGQLNRSAHIMVRPIQLVTLRQSIQNATYQQKGTSVVHSSCTATDDGEDQGNTACCSHEYCSVADNVWNFNNVQYLGIVSIRMVDKSVVIRVDSQSRYKKDNCKGLLQTKQPKQKTSVLCNINIIIIPINRFIISLNIHDVVVLEIS